MKFADRPRFLLMGVVEIEIEIYIFTLIITADYCSLIFRAILFFSFFQFQFLPFLFFFPPSLPLFYLLFRTLFLSRKAVSYNGFYPGFGQVFCWGTPCNTFFAGDIYYDVMGMVIVCGGVFYSAYVDGD